MSISKLYTWNPNTAILSAEVTAEINQLITEVNLMFKKDGSDPITGNLIVNGNTTLGDSSSDTVTITGTPTAASANGMRAASTRSTGTSVGLGGVAISTASGTRSTTSTSYSDITGLSCTLITSGRPIFVGLFPDTSNFFTLIDLEKSGAASVNQISGQIKFLRDSTGIAEFYMTHRFPTDTSTSHYVSSMPNGFSVIDTSGAGTYTFKAQFKVGASSQLTVQDCKLIAFEL